MNAQQEEKKMDGSTEITTIQPRSEMSAILDLAKDPAMDVEKLKALVSMQEGILDRQAKQAFAEAFVAMKPHLKRIENKHKNSQTNSKYAKLEDINREIDPILEQFGFASMTPVRSQTDKTVTVAAIILHKAGHQEETELTLPLDDAGIQGKVNKTAPHAIASSIKYCRRIVLCAALNVSTGDGEDRDGNQTQQSQPIEIEQAADIDTRARALQQNSPGYHARFLKWAGVQAATEIMDGNYKKVIAALETAEKEAKKKEAKK
jgi:hypothetical protein